MKIIVVGDVSVGKTAIINRLVTNTYIDKYKATIGVDFATKQINRNGEDLRVDLWDIAGQERFNSMSKIYTRGAVGAILVFDITNPSTQDSIVNWKTFLDANVFFHDTTLPIPVALFANKIDKENISNEELDELKDKHHFCTVIGTSAKTNFGLYPGLIKLIEEIEHNIAQLPIPGQEERGIKVDDEAEVKKGCCS